MHDAADTNYLLFPDFFKAARPAEEAGERFIYMEASNEARDMEGERVLSKALAESADYYASFGNCDLDHLTQLGQRRNIPNHYLFEIGRPVEVKVDQGRTFVKAAIYAGEGQVAKHANDFWESITALTPAKRWYPSVGGSVLAKTPVVDPDTGNKETVVTRVRWTNIGLSQTPVNLNVPTVGTIPMGVLSKAWGVGGLNLSKALEAGYGTDSATLEGGGALRRESLDPEIQNYWDLRDELARHVKQAKPKSLAAIHAHAQQISGLSKALTAEWTTRFLAEVAGRLFPQGIENGRL